MAARPLLPSSRTAMKALIGILIAAALAVASGCAKTDWIDRTLVTVDVTGSWIGSWTGGTSELLFELEQKGSVVKGFMRTVRGTSSTYGLNSGPIEGSVAGDVFRFSQTNGPLAGC